MPLRIGAFTLIEIMAVVVLISMLAVASGGMFVGTYRRQQVLKSARQLMLAAKYARIIAIERQTPCTLRIDADQRSFLLSAMVADELTEQMIDQVVTDSYCRPARLAQGINFEKIAVLNRRPDQAQDRPANCITFYPDGSADSATVQIGDGKRHYYLRIAAATGRSTLTFGPADEEIASETIDLDQ